MPLKYPDEAAARSDQALVDDVRAGRGEAMAQLYERHKADAMRVGRIVPPDGDGEDLVAEAFVRVFAKIVDGGGPTENFRAYLHTVIRRLNIDRIRLAGREQASSHQPWVFDDRVDDDIEALDQIDAAAATAAFASLSKSWQQILWMLEVDGRTPTDIATELSVTAAQISAIAFRAREGLRRAYLDQHLPQEAPVRCTWTRDRLSDLVRGGLSARAASKVDRHLDTCTECTLVQQELEQLNHRLGAAWWPVVLVGGVAIGTGIGTTTPSSHRPHPRSSEPSPGGRGTLPRNVRAVRRRTNSAMRRVSRMPAFLQAGIIVTATMAAVVAADTAVPWLNHHDEPVTPEHAITPGEKSPATNRPETVLEGIKETPALDELILPPDVPTLWPDMGANRFDDPGPGPEPRPEPEPGPVDLSVGIPTIEATSEPDRWVLTVPVMGNGSTSGPDFTIELALTMTTRTGFVERVSAGWDCGDIESGDDQGDPYFFDSVSCRYTYRSWQPVTPFQLVIFSTDPGGSVAVTSLGNDDPDTSNDDRTF